MRYFGVTGGLIDSTNHVLEEKHEKKTHQKTTMRKANQIKCDDPSGDFNAASRKFITSVNERNFLNALTGATKPRQLEQ